MKPLTPDRFRMRLIPFIAAVVVVGQANAAHVYFEFTDFISGPVSNKVVRITSLSTPGASGNTIVVTDQRRLSTAADGTLTVSNMVAGTYRVEPLASIWQIGAFNILVPDTNVLLNANTLLTSTNTASANQAWTTGQSDARYVGKTNSWSSGQTLTNAYFYGSTNYWTAGTAAEINRSSGRVRLASGQSVYYVTNSLVSTNTAALVTINTAGAGTLVSNAVTAAGLLTITTIGTVGVDTDISFFLTNP